MLVGYKSQVRFQDIQSKMNVFSIANENNMTKLRDRLIYGLLQDIQNSQQKLLRLNNI